MSPDEMKQCWQQLGSNPEYDSSRLIDRVTSGRITSARERLMRRYRMMFSVICPIGIFASIPLWRELSWWQTACIILFFLVAGGMDWWLYRGIKGIDFATEGVQSVADKARYYRKRHWIFQAVLTPCAAGLLMIYFSLSDEEYYRAGMWVGLALGLAFGLGVWLQMMRDYKKML